MLCEVMRLREDSCIDHAAEQWRIASYLLFAFYRVLPRSRGRVMRQT
jgi:hypothetical protein